MACRQLQHERSRAAPPALAKPARPASASPFTQPAWASAPLAPTFKSSRWQEARRKLLPLSTPVSGAVRFRGATLLERGSATNSVRAVDRATDLAGCREA